MIELIEVNKNNLEHINSLYALLKGKKFNISHEKTPTFEEHLDFVRNSNYRNWFLINHNSKLSGSFYLTFDNVIGLNLLTNECLEYIEVINLILQNYKPLPPIASLRSKYFHVNANPKNLNLIRALKSIKMTHIQNTYAYMNLY